jgi:hypothetical protein
MPLDAFWRWIDAAPALHQLHRQHRPDLDWRPWLETVVLPPLFDKGTLQRTPTEVLDGL